MARNDAAARGSAPVRALWPAEERALKDAAARGSAPAKAEAAKAAPVTVDIVTPNATVDIVTPAGDSARQGDAHLVAAQGSGRLSALTVHQQTPASSQAPTPTSPAGDSIVAGEGPAPSVVCVACQGSGLLNSQVNLRLFRLIGSGQLRLGQTSQAAPTTPVQAATPAPAAAANPAGPGNGTEVSPSSVRTQVDLVLQLFQVFAVCLKMEV